MIRYNTFLFSLLFIVFVTPPHLHAQAVISESPLQVLEDEGGAMTIEQVLSERSRFKTVQTQTPNYFTSSSAYWFRIPVANHHTDNIQLFFVIPNPPLDYVTLYVEGLNGIRGIQKSGDRIPYNSRPFRDATNLVLPFDLAGDETAVLYVRVQGEAQTLLFPHRILDENALKKSMLNSRLFHGMMVGFLIALLISNFFLFITLRERARLYYLCYLPFAFLACTAINGFGPRYIYPGNTWLGNEGVTFLHGLSVIFSLLFTRVFIDLKNNPKIDRITKVLIGIGALMIFSAIFLPVSFSYKLGIAMLLISPFVLLIMGLYVLAQGRTELRFYVLAQFFTWTGTLIFALMVIGVFPYYSALLESIPTGIGIGALMHSMAVAERIRILRKDNLLAETQARRNLEIRKNELEQLVSDRTAELEQAYKQAELQAATDVLTGIYNRRGLLKAAQSMIQQTLRYGWPLSIAMLDIDHFKAVNDQYGHLEGDRVLQKLAQTVSNGLRGSDLFGRIGGEEFLIIMPNTPIKAAMELAGRLRATIENNVQGGEPPRRVTASFGVAQLTEHINNIDQLMKYADDALYRAKQNGRNRVESSSPVH